MTVQQKLELIAQCERQLDLAAHHGAPDFIFHRIQAVIDRQMECPVVRKQYVHAFYMEFFG